MRKNALLFGGIACFSVAALIAGLIALYVGLNYNAEIGSIPDSTTSVISESESNDQDSINKEIRLPAQNPSPQSEANTEPVEQPVAKEDAPTFQPPSTTPFVVENNGVFELPIEGSHGIALIGLKVHLGDGAGGECGQVVSAGTPFTILIDGETRVLGRFKDGSTGWLDKNYIMVNLPDIIPSIIYKNSNAEASLMRNLGMEIEGVTGQQLYEVKVYNEKLDREEFIMPVQYRTAEKIMEAQKIAKDRNLSIILYEGFRPYSAQTAVASAMRVMAGKNPDTKASLQKDGFSMDFYISAGVSNHQQGAAVDVSLARVSEWQDESINGNVVSMPKLYEEFRYGKISTDAEDGVKFAGHQYRPSLPDDTTYWMPTPMHELSYLAGTFTGPTKTYSHGAWKTALDNGSVKRAEYWTDGAQKMQDIFVAAGMDPLASEWWHFNDIESRAVAKKAGAEGKFEAGTELFSITPAKAIAMLP